MPRQRSDIPTEAEQRVLKVIWARGEASVREVMEALKDDRPLAYNTVLTLLRILTEKGHVEPRQEGRAFVYRARLSRSEARTRALKRVLTQFFEGSPTALAQHLIRHETLTDEEVAAIRRELEGDRTDAAAAGEDDAGV